MSTEHLWGLGEGCTAMGHLIITDSEVTKQFEHWLNKVDGEYSSTKDGGDSYYILKSFHLIRDVPGKILESDSVSYRVVQDKTDDSINHTNRFIQDQGEAPFSYDPNQDFKTEPGR